MATTDLGVWEPFDVATVQALMAGTEVTWWLSGGEALDVFIGRTTRAHADVDISLRRTDLSTLVGRRDLAQPPLLGVACQTRRVQLTATAGLGFLLAVLWFDLMFDVQGWGHHDAVLPTGVVDSIAAYYRRVTTKARPMNRLIALFMLLTLASLIGEIVRDDVRSWVAWTSLGLTAVGVGLAAARTVRDAVRLGTQSDSAERQSDLARRIFGDHVVCFVAIVTALILQVGFT